MTSYELPLPPLPTDEDRRLPHYRILFLPAPLTLRNIHWFCRLRWMVVGILALFWLVGRWPGLARQLGLNPPGAWPLAAAALLAAANLVFLLHAWRLGRNLTATGARANLRVQIALDLLVLTAVVHFVGSLGTTVTFTFLFHIVLACIFFPSAHSLIVTLSACLLYAGVLGLEVFEVWTPGRAFAGLASVREAIAAQATFYEINLLSTMVIWLLVWHLASTLSRGMREREFRLAEANQRLLRAQEEKVRHMLRTTHELKAPFAAIHANTQLLLKGHCGELPGAALPVIERIAARCQRLAGEIQEMLQLANLRARHDGELPWTRLDLERILRWCLQQARHLTGERKIALEEDLAPAEVVGVEDHLQMLFGNLLANAVIYSQPGGKVTLACRREADGGTLVTIADRGIGIPPEKLPRIFDEYYRTEEAVQHNRVSTGLGLAIVRHVAEGHRIRIRVDSAPGQGTTFTLRFPSSRRWRATREQRKELTDGLPVAR